MKNIFNYYKRALTNIHWIGIIMIGITSIGIGYLIGNDWNNPYWGIFATFMVFSIFIWKRNSDDDEIVRRNKWLDEKYGDDPEWEIYKELKKKFRQ